MATTFIAKHGLKSNINKLKLSEGEIAIAYSEDKTKAEIYSGSKDGTPILLIQEINVSELLANANEYTNTKISELVDGAPEAMDTLKELADAIAQNSDIMSALQSAIGNKANEAELSGHISDTNNPHNVTKEQLDLENVDNTSDIDKPISTAIQEALNDKAPTNHASSATTYGMGNASNYGHLKLSDSTTSTSSTSSGIAATPKAVKMSYDKAVSAYNLADTKLGKDFVSGGYTGIDEVTARLNGIEEGAEVNTVTSVAGMTGDVTLTKENVGLSDVENVSTNEQTPTFTEASTRANITSGETLSTLFGKIKKLFTDLKTVAFTGSYTDLSNKPTSMQNPNSLTLTMNGSSSSYNGSATASKSWYAPTSAGSTGYNLISNGSGAPVWQQPPYAVCNTATTTAAKTVSITNFKLITGARVLVKFTYAHKSSGSATLNISNTGAKTICIEKPDAPYGNSSFSITSITSQNSWQAGDILDLVYNGTYWCVIGSTGFLQSGRYSSNVIIGTEENNLGAYCDYICDQTIIQQAINDLPSTGGKIVLLEGVYNISEELTLPYPITFEGTVNTSLCVLSQGLLRHDINNISVSNTATFKDININFMSGTNDSEGYVGAFENFKLTFENCTITKRTSYQSVQRLFLNCKVKMINTDVDITMPNSGFGAPYDCFWVFGESTVELLNTHIWLTGENPVNNGVFYDSKGTMTGGWITNTKKDTSNHGKSYILHSSPITFLGTQIRCREFAQEWNSNTSNGFSPSLDSCKIEILDGGDFSCSHASHIDLVLSSSSKTSVISAYALISNSKLFITFDHQLELRDYAFLEACYVNRVNYKASGSASSAKTTDTSTVTSMAKPIFIDTEGNK